MAMSLSTLIIGSFSLLERDTQLIKAQALAQEGIEAVVAIKNRDWNELNYNRSAVAVVDNHWVFSGEGTTGQIEKFTRTIDFMPIYRNNNGDIVLSSNSEAYQDASSTQAIVNISWDIGKEIDSNLERTVYLINR